MKRNGHLGRCGVTKKCCCHFSGAHSSKQCPIKEIHNCYGCVQSNDKYHSELVRDHEAFDKENCSSCKHLCERRLQRTCYPYNPEELNSTAFSKAERKYNVSSY